MTTHQFSRRLDSTEKITYTYEGETYENYMGNYWSDYMGDDGDGNGIGDTPYGINGDFDYHPLMNPLRITLRRRCQASSQDFHEHGRIQSWRPDAHKPVESDRRAAERYLPLGS